MKTIKAISEKTLENPDYYTLAINDYNALKLMRENNIYSNGTCVMALDAVEKFLKACIVETKIMSKRDISHTHDSGFLIRNAKRISKALNYFPHFELPKDLYKEIKMYYEDRSNIRYPVNNKTFICNDDYYENCMNILDEVYIHCTNYLLNHKDKVTPEVYKVVKKEEKNAFDLSVSHLSNALDK